MNNFTPRAQQVLALARKESDRFKHGYVGEGHLLLGLINLGQGVAANVLEEIGLDLESVRIEVKKSGDSKLDEDLSGAIPYTQDVKTALAIASREAVELNHSYVGTEHLFLALLKSQGIASLIFNKFNVDVILARKRILEEIDPNFVKGDQMDGKPSKNPDDEIYVDDRSVVTVEKRVILAGVPEVATVEDHLGVEPYAVALAGFICSEKTGSPMTISVEGNWGAGKSSFLKMVRRELVQNKKRVVWFNPWRHDVGEGLWSAFLVSFIDQVRADMNMIERCQCDLDFRARTICTSIKDRGGAWLLGILWLVFFFFIRKWLLGNIEWTSKQVLGIATAVLPFIPLLWVIWKSWRTFMGTLRKDLERAWNRDNEFEKVCLVEKASGQFRSFLKSYTRKSEKCFEERNLIKRWYSPKSWKKWWEMHYCEKLREPIFVIIDDLDRCAGPKAVDLLDSLQLLIAGNGDEEKGFPVVYLLGLDREKVAAGVAVKYECILPYVGDWDDKDKKTKGEIGRSFGYEYLQKFIDVPFRIPAPGDDNIKRFIDHLAGVVKKDAGEDAVFSITTTGEIPTGDNSLKYEPDGGNDNDTQLDDLDEKAHRRIEEIDLRACLHMAAHFLENNPRRIKQFKNLLTLRVYQGEAKEIRLFDHGVTVEMVAKVLLVELARPTLYRHMAEDYFLADDIATLWNDDPYPGPEPEVDPFEGTTHIQRIEKKLPKSEQDWVFANSGYAKSRWDIEAELHSGFPRGDNLKAILSLSAPIKEFEE